MKPIRINKYLAESGIASRRKSEEYILQGRVTVNGKRVEISIKYFVIPEKWNSEAGQVKGTKPEIKALNRFLLDQKSKAYSIYEKIVERSLYGNINASRNSA